MNALVIKTSAVAIRNFKDALLALTLQLLARLLTNHLPGLEARASGERISSSALHILLVRASLAI